VLGGGYHKISRDKKSIPVFAREGAIIPHAEVEGNYSGNPETLVLNVYNVANGEYTLYEDDGESTDYQEDKGAFTKFEWKDNLFTINPAVGEIDLLPKERTYTICFEYDVEGVEVKINGEGVEAQTAENTVIISGVKPTDKVEIRTNL
jgi:alpha-glucosidase (family GH31 glycosyl hydrolase)